MDSFATYGSPTTSAPVVYMPLEDVEKPECYCAGGYHPITIGDHLIDRYDVVHKLGFGTYSKTWLARDRITKKYVTIKIVVAESEPGDDVHPGNALVSRVLETFSLDGPNGRHRYLVMEPGLMSLAEAKDASYTRLFQLPVAKAIAAQIIQSVAFLHHRGVVHADLHTGNIMLRLPNSIDDLSPEELYRKYGQPTLEPFVRLDGKPLPNGVPTHGVVPIWLGKESELVTLSEAKIFITDFGESFLPSITQRYYSNTPSILAPPEAYFLPHEPLSFPADIWTLACTLWDILGQRSLFEGFNPSKDWMVKEHVDTLGKLPCEWWQKWGARERWFTEEATRISVGAGRSLVERFIDSMQEQRREIAMENIGEVEKDALLQMIRDMLAFRPTERLTAAEVMESEWMVRWGLPVLDEQVTA
ncbi:protein kinase domain protein [Paecilomyces variotii No. 5]|uniref:Protein kinase domain protein n=1 Tax=Byssochlamys spectabilis (strain No. 5 / NBRC 109023) TaxID=1356009 RepID=V5FQK1_BYSSN|nr:protein kinase domain protein [Paecilomyces variotii No. 5]